MVVSQLAIEQERTMSEILIRQVTDENMDDFCKLCIPPEKRNDPAFVMGIELKREWARKTMQEWGSFAYLAYQRSTPVALIQYEPLPEERIIHIHCIYVPGQQYWQKGIATQLLFNLIQDAKKPSILFDNQPALGLIVKTFSGEKPGQYPARLFFTRRGFKQVGDDPDLLYYPLQEGFTYKPGEKPKIAYVPQEEDRGKVVIIYGPSFCPFSYLFLQTTERAIKQIAPEIPVRWINASQQPEEVRKRGRFEGCVVNAIPLKTFVLDEDEFEKEVKSALGLELPGTS